MDIKQFKRRPFPVEGVQVTEENIQEVAEWCGGDVRRTVTETYIKVKTHRPLNEKQKRAYVSDWVLKAKTGFKVYTDQAMENSFEENIVYTEEDALAQLEGHHNVFDDNRDETEEAVQEILAESPEELIEDLQTEEPSGPESKYTFSKFLEEE